MNLPPRRILGAVLGLLVAVVAIVLGPGAASFVLLGAALGYLVGAVLDDPGRAAQLLQRLQER